MSKASKLYFSAAMLAVLLTSTAHAAGTTKDIVLDRVLTPAVSSITTTNAQTQDAMAVSVLLESPDGTLSPKSTNTLFRTGDRFRIKLLAVVQHQSERHHQPHPDLARRSAGRA